MHSDFKKDYPFEKRKAEADRIVVKHPSSIPIVYEKVGESDIPTLDKKKYLVPSDLTVGQFMYVIRKRIRAIPEKAIFLFIAGILPPAGELMSAMHHEYEDGFLCIR